MRKINLLWALICSMFLFVSCSDDDPVNTNGDVPTAVLQSFQNRFKGVEDVHWDQVKDYRVARFNLNTQRSVSVKYSTSAWFLEDGSYLQTSFEMDLNVTPQVVKDALKAYMDRFYPDWEIDDCEKVSREGMGEIFIIEIEKGKMEREISISTSGEILKDVLDDDDEDEILPILLPEEIKAALEKIFPDSYHQLTILELEFDDDEIELDIIEDGRHKEIELDLDYNLVSVEYKVSFDEAKEMIDSDVLKKLDEWATQKGIDIYNPELHAKMEIEVKRHAKKGISFEIEIEIEGSDLEIEIDAEGHIKLD